MGLFLDPTSPENIITKVTTGQADAVTLIVFLFLICIRLIPQASATLAVIFFICSVDYFLLFLQYDHDREFTFCGMVLITVFSIGVVFTPLLRLAYAIILMCFPCNHSLKKVYWHERYTDKCLSE